MEHQKSFSLQDLLFLQGTKMVEISRRSALSPATATVNLSLCFQYIGLKARERRNPTPTPLGCFRSQHPCLYPVLLQCRKTTPPGKE